MAKDEQDVVERVTATYEGSSWKTKEGSKELTGRLHADDFATARAALSRSEGDAFTAS